MICCFTSKVRIHFLDNSSKVFLVEGDETTVKDLIVQCLQKFGVLEAEEKAAYFGLFESRNGGSVDGCLNMESTVKETLQRWSEEGIQDSAKFLFMIRLLMPCLWGLQLKDVVAFRLNKPKSALPVETYLEEAEIVDANCLHLQFIQAVYMVITGRIPTKQEQALDFGAIHFLVKFGHFLPERHQPGFLGPRIVEFIPIKHLRGGGSSSGLANVSAEEWERKLLLRVQSYASAAMERDSAAAGGAAEASDFEAGASDNDDDDDEADEQKDELSSGDRRSSRKKIVYFRRGDVAAGSPISPLRKYMEMVYSMVPIYGCTFFRCSQRVTRALPEQVQLGIYHHGLGIFDKTKRLVRMIHIEDIFRWGFKPNQMFYFEISTENSGADLRTGSLEFETAEGKVMSDLLTDYAMAFLREREKEDERVELMKAGKYEVGGHVVAPAPPVAPPTSLPPPPPPPPRAAAPGRGDSAEDAAATRIQAAVRGFLLRNDWAREDGAILIQVRRRLGVIHFSCVDVLFCLAF